MRRQVDEIFVAGFQAALNSPEVTGLVEASNEMRLAYIEHMKTKFTSDGSHFQADVRLNEAAAGLGLALVDIKRTRTTEVD